MALTSSSTYSDALAQYRNNLAYYGNVTKAKDLHEAILFLLEARPTQSSAADGRGMSKESLIALIDRVEQYLALADTTNRPKAYFIQGRALM